MNNEIQIFTHPQFGQIRTMGTSENPEFCAMDLCKALGYTNGRKAVIDHVDEPDVTKRYVGVVTGKRADGTDATQDVLLTFVNESGMYSLVLGSKLPSAKQFKRWLTSEVLPSIRKKGSYSLSIESLSRKDLALMVVQAEEEKEQILLENKKQLEIIEEQKPKVCFADAVLSSKDSILIGELAKLLCQNGYQTGEIRLYEKLRNEGYLCKYGSDRNLPTQRYLEMGLFEITKGARTGNGGVMHTTRTTKVTQRGCEYFLNKFLNEKAYEKVNA